MKNNYPLTGYSEHKCILIKKHRGLFHYTWSLDDNGKRFKVNVGKMLYDRVQIGEKLTVGRIGRKLINIRTGYCEDYAFEIKRNVNMYNHVLVVTYGEKRYEAIIESAPHEKNTMLIWLKDFEFPKEEIEPIKNEMVKWFSKQNEKCIFYSGGRC